MCLLAMFFRVLEDAPLIVGANRDELYSRPGEPPQILDGPLPAVAGLDPVARGTWFGVNQRGVFVAVTNRPKSELSSKLRSRGLLVRDLLGCRTATQAVDQAVRELGQGCYAGCNLMCADQDNAMVIHAGDWLRIRPLPPGLHGLTSHDVNDASDRRLGHALWWLSQRSYRSAKECLQALEKLCSQSGNGGPAICQRGDQSGTVSSSLLALRSPLAQSSYWHAQGPPDRTPYQDYSPVLRHLFASSSDRE
ncbi:MAG TPA: NRDE family protein [Gemmataceae bacterium]|nr:NRDE family protein [Gemmataceae bacterium]